MVTMEMEKRRKARHEAFGIAAAALAAAAASHQQQRPTTTANGSHPSSSSSISSSLLLSPLLPPPFRMRRKKNKHSPPSPSRGAAGASSSYGTNPYYDGPRRRRATTWSPSSSSLSAFLVPAAPTTRTTTANSRSLFRLAASHLSRRRTGGGGKGKGGKGFRRGGGGGSGRAGGAGAAAAAAANPTAGGEREDDGRDDMTPYELDLEAALRLELSAKRFFVDFRRILPEQQPLVAAASSKSSPPPWAAGSSSASSAASTSSYPDSNAPSQSSYSSSYSSSSSQEVDLRALWGVALNDVVYHVLRPMAASLSTANPTTSMTTSALGALRLGTAWLPWTSTSSSPPHQQRQYRQQQKQDAILRRYHLLNTIDRLQTDLLRWTSTRAADEDGLDRRFFEPRLREGEDDGDGPSILHVLLRQNGYVTCWKQIKELLVRGRYFSLPAPPSSSSWSDANNNHGTGGSSGQNQSRTPGGDPILNAYESRLLATSLQSMSLELPPSQRKLLRIVASGGTAGDNEDDQVPALLDADRSQDETFSDKVSREQRLLERTREHELRHEKSAVKAVKASLEAEEEAEKRAGTLMRPLSDDELQLVHEAMYGRGSDDEVLAREGSDTVMRSSLRKLAPRQWLNDEVIHFFYMMLAKRDAELCRLDPTRKRCHFFKSFFITKLLQEGHALYDGQYDYKSVKRWSKNVPGAFDGTTNDENKCALFEFRSILTPHFVLFHFIGTGKDIFALDKVFFPINVGRSHWVCAVAYMQLKRIQFFDSLGADGMEYMEYLFRYLQDEHLDKKKGLLPDADEWKLIPCDPSETPQQLNGTFDIHSGYYSSWSNIGLTPYGIACSFFVAPILLFDMGRVRLRRLHLHVRRLHQQGLPARVRAGAHLPVPRADRLGHSAGAGHCVNQRFSYDVRVGLVMTSVRGVLHIGNEWNSFTNPRVYAIVDVLQQTLSC
jgi:Ulp1 protease family, C-terminal catalytic domain